MRTVPPPPQLNTKTMLWLAFAKLHAGAFKQFPYVFEKWNFYKGGGLGFWRTRKTLLGYWTNFYCKLKLWSENYLKAKTFNRKRDLFGKNCIKCLTPQWVGFDNWDIDRMKRPLRVLREIVRVAKWQTLKGAAQFLLNLTSNSDLAIPPKHRKISN